MTRDDVDVRTAERWLRTVIALVLLATVLFGLATEALPWLMATFDRAAETLVGPWA